MRKRSGAQIWKAVWSPSGQRIAYFEKHGLALSDPTVDSLSLWTRDANGGDPQFVLKDALLERALFWAADGCILYSSSEDSASQRGDQAAKEYLKIRGGVE